MVHNVDLAWCLHVLLMACAVYTAMGQQVRLLS